ncbi:hypothetical protein CMK11_15315 [Candidatus Poribacteria bacterium]|nr:hypothetical protein [Candidatus Poribacteria bacterium]
MRSTRLRHITICREPGRYAGWPANYGIWNWGNEIVVGFTYGHHDSDAGFHTRDRTRPFVGMQARSLDGGETWHVNPTPARAPGDKGMSADEHMAPELKIGADEPVAIPEEPGRIDFAHHDFALMAARNGLRAGAVSWFYASTDRCRSWDGPYALPDFGQTGIAARTDYQVSGADECTLYLTAAKPDGGEGWVFVARTEDAGRTFDFRSWIGPEPDGFSIMPASVRLSDRSTVVAVRCRGEATDFRDATNWIDLYRSDDDGLSWGYVNRPAPNTGVGGNPPTLTHLRDGRLCLTYGFRDAPYRMCARLSPDEGATWGDEIVLRDNGGGHDIGYPRTVQRADGGIVTIYYWHDTPDGERHIAATIWDA